EAKPVAELEAPGAISRNHDPFSVALLLDVELNGAAKLPVNISLHIVESLFAADRHATRGGQVAGHAVGHHQRSLAIGIRKAKIAAPLGGRKFGLNQPLVEARRVVIRRSDLLV